jgi:two-component system, NarL family, nitrate/nitrite response regulator NarL
LQAQRISPSHPKYGVDLIDPNWTPSAKTYSSHLQVTKMSSMVCVVVHPSRIVREGLKRILAKSPFEPACATSGIADVPTTIAGAGEQVLVLIGVREENGLAEDLSAVKASFPDAHVVVVGDVNHLDLVTAALELGATSFVDENVATPSLIKELELVAQGEPVISVLIVKRVLGKCSSPPSEQAVTIRAVDEQPPPETQGQTEQKSQLSGREAAILSGLVQGASNKMIACQLKITEATVKVHVKAILRKIRVRNRTQAAIWALKCQGSPKRLSAEENGSSISQGSLGGERSDTPMICPGLREASAH